MRTHQAPRRAWLGLAVLALPCMITVMDLTVLNLAVPHLSTALKPTGAQLLWIIDIYGFMLAGALIPVGGLGDRIGRRKLLLIGAAAFGTASALAAFSTSALMLITTRALPALRSEHAVRRCLRGGRSSASQSIGCCRPAPSPRRIVAQQVGIINRDRFATWPCRAGHHDGLVWRRGP